jgi:hypothetical protein
MEITTKEIIMIIAAVAYVTVTFIQAYHIRNMKEITDTMNSYMKIFSIDEVKKYSDLRAESAKIEAANFVANNEKVEAFTKAIMDDKERDFWQFYENEKKEEYFELFNLAVQIIIQNQQNKKNMKMILDILPRTKDKLLKVIDENKRQ